MGASRKFLVLHTLELMDFGRPPIENLSRPHTCQ